jgi:hypothetical protein
VLKQLPIGGDVGRRRWRRGSKNIVDLVGSPRTLSTHINPTKGKKGQDFLQYQGFSKKRKKTLKKYHETTSKTIQPVKVLQCLGPSTAHEFLELSTPSKISP